MKVIGISVGIMAVFFAGWFLRPALDSGTKQVGGESQQEGRALVGGSSAGARHGGSDATQPRRTKTVIVDKQSDKELYAGAELEQYADTVIEGFEKKLRSRLDQFLLQLNLSEAQLAEIEKFLQQEVLAYAEVSKKLFKGEVEEADDLEALKDLSSLNGLSEVFEEILTPEQLEAYEKLEGEEKQGRVEASALRQLAGIQTGLGLSKEQKDAVYEVLYDEAELNVDSTTVTGEILSGMGIQDFFDTSGMGELMKFAESHPIQNEGDAGGDLYEQFLDAKTERFSGIFTEEQQSAYRDRLEQQIAPVRAQEALLENEENTAQP